MGWNQQFPCLFASGLVDCVLQLQSICVCIVKCHISYSLQEVTPSKLAKSYLFLRKYNSEIDSALLEVVSLKKSPITCSQQGCISMTVVGVPHYVVHFPGALVGPVHPVRAIMTDSNMFLLWFKLPGGFVNTLYEG